MSSSWSRGPLLTLRDVQLDDLEIFRRWRADPRYAAILRRPGTPATEDEAIDWFRTVQPLLWLAVCEGSVLRGYGMLTARDHGPAEVSVLTDPDRPCDVLVLRLLCDEARRIGLSRLVAETYTDERATMVQEAGFQPVQHWTLLLRTPGPASG